MADELEGFEQAWGGIGDDQFHGWNDAFNFPRISGEIQVLIFSGTQSVAICFSAIDVGGNYT